MRMVWSGACLWALLGPMGALAAPFTPGNLAVYRVGSGASSLVNTGNPVFIDEYTPTGTLVQSIALPSSVGAPPAYACVGSGTATSEGMLSRSADGRYLLIPCYSSNLPAAASLSGTTGTAVPRVVARMDGTGAIDTSTALTDYASGNNPRSAASSNGLDLWVSGGAGGVRYATLGASTSTQLSTTVTNLRQSAVFDGQLYVSTSSGSTVRIGAVGSGLPTTTGQTISNLPGFPTAGSPYSFALVDLSASVPGADTLYVAEDTTGGGQIQKYSLVGGNWTASGSISAAAVRGLVASVSAGVVSLYGTTGGSAAAGGGTLYAATDASGYNVAASGTATSLATAAANTAFRGIAFAPVAAVAQPDLTASISGPAGAVVSTPYDYSLTFANGGSAAAGAFAGTFTLPAGVSFGSVTAQGGCSGTQAAGVVSFACSGLAAGASATALVSVTPASAGTVTVGAGAVVADSGAAILESNEANNSSTGTVTTNVSNGAAPQIQFDAATTTDFLTIPLDGPGAVSGVIGDSTDPMRFQGVAFLLSDTDTSVGSLSVVASSNNALVVPNANLTLSGSGAGRVVRVEPIGVGYADISLTVSDPQGNSDTYLLRYAASDGSTAPASTRWHTGGADASTAVALDANRMVAAIDEDQRLRIADRDESGLPLNELDVNSLLGLTDVSGGVPREVDIEASVRVGNRLYWLGSHSNSASGNLRPNRQRLFALDYSAPSTLSYVGRYDGLRSDLLTWDSSNVHGLGANYFGLTASAAVGVIPEDASGAGFNIEGLAIAPNGQAYLAFRAPIVPASQRTRALIVPINNLADLVNGNPASGPATFGAPIQLDLGGRGIRSLDCNASECLIIGGAATAGGNFRLYTWDGNPASQPVERSGDLSGLNPEGIVELPATLSSASVVQILSDLGDTVFYGDGTIAKDLPEDNWKKFRSDLITLGAPASLSISDASITEGNAGTSNLAFTVTLSRAVSNTVSVQFQSADGTASVAGGDFQSASGTLSFAPGETSKTVNVQINGDLIVEAAETLSVQLSQVQGAELADASALGTINNDDSASIAINDVTQAEGSAGSSQFTFNVTLTGAVQGGFSVPFATADASATAPSDYASQSAQLSFTGSLNEVQTISVVVVGDTVYEGNESFAVNLGASSNAAVTVSDSAGIGTISEDDRAALTLGASATPTPAAVGQPVTVTATISLPQGAPQPGGSIVVNGPGGDGCSMVLPALSCSYTPSYLGAQTLSLSYAGDASVLPATASTQHTVYRVADLSISKSDGRSVVNNGELLSYLIVVRNDGPNEAPGVQIQDLLPPTLSNATWTCAGSACPAGAGSGSIQQTATLPANQQLSYTLNATVAAGNASLVENTASVAASVAAPNFVFDPDTADQTATDVNLIDTLFADGYE